MLGWQKQCILGNLTSLYQFTDCNVEFVSLLVSQQVLSQEEGTSVSDQHRSNAERVATLYRLVQTRSNDSYWKLVNALQRTCQSGASEILTSPNHQEYSKYKLVVVNQNETLRTKDNTVFIYKGTFGTRPAVIKVYDKLLSASISQATKEVDMLTQIDWHDNIIRCFVAKYICFGGNHCFAVVLGDHISLKKYYEIKGAQTIPQIVKQIFLADLINGVRYLHESNVLHLDLDEHSAYICNVEANRPRLKIGEFAMSKKLDALTNEVLVSMEALCENGAAAYFTPEVTRLCQDLDTYMTEEPLSLGYSVDVFCVGVLIYFILSGGKHPFGIHIEKLYNLSHHKTKIDQTFLEMLTRDQQVLLQDILNEVSCDRPKLSQLVSAYVTSTLN